MHSGLVSMRSATTATRFRRLCTAANLEWKRHTPRKGVPPDSVPLLMVHGFACGKNDWGSLPRAIASKSQREVLTFESPSLM